MAFSLARCRIDESIGRIFGGGLVAYICKTVTSVKFLYVLYGNSKVYGSFGHLII
ncbi:hypothetical protein LX36DRAFT_662414 [Colletotrichum falcatum]|nr:hypothetical protein LX36DRAFT_662414 [Colletotrichum falcatum]